MSSVITVFADISILAKTLKFAVFPASSVAVDNVLKSAIVIAPVEATSELAFTVNNISLVISSPDFISCLIITTFF